MKPILYLETDLFHEEEIDKDYISTISRFFNIKPISFYSLLYDKPKNAQFLRSSLQVAQQLGYKFEFSNCLNWLPIFRQNCANSDAYFNDIKYFVEGNAAFPLYLRPAHGLKAFAGQVFETQERLKTEYNHVTKNLNYTDNLICLAAKTKIVQYEWRLVFVNGKYISGSQYMKNGKLSIGRISDSVIEFAQKIAANPYFQNIFNFVLDICSIHGYLKLLEINSFECSSFYGADLAEIYKAYAESADFA